MICSKCNTVYSAAGEGDKCPRAAINLIELAEKEVIEKAKALHGVWKAIHREEKYLSSYDALGELLAAVTLLESREAMAETQHLDPVKTLQRAMAIENAT